MLEHDIKKILVSHDEITEAAKKLGAQINQRLCREKIPILVEFLKRIYSFYG